MEIKNALTAPGYTLLARPTCGTFQKLSWTPLMNGTAKIALRVLTEKKMGSHSKMSQCQKRRKIMKMKLMTISKLKSKRRRSQKKISSSRSRLRKRKVVPHLVTAAVAVMSAAMTCISDF